MRATSHATATAPQQTRHVTIDIPMHTPESYYDDSIHLRVTFAVTQGPKAARIKYVTSKVCRERDVSFLLQQQIKEQCVEQLTQCLYERLGNESPIGSRPKAYEKGPYIHVPLSAIHIDPTLITALANNLDDIYDDIQYRDYLEEQHRREEEGCYDYSD